MSQLLALILKANFGVRIMYNRQIVEENYIIVMVFILICYMETPNQNNEYIN